MGDEPDNSTCNKLTSTRQLGSCLSNVYLVYVMFPGCYSELGDSVAVASVERDTR